jgi:hypothetical protein
MERPLCYDNNAICSGRQRYWKNEAYYKVDQYVECLERLQKGLAPIGDDGFSMHLHHPDGRNGDFYYVFDPVTYTEHMRIHYGGE